MVYFEISDTACINVNFLSMEFVTGVVGVSLYCVVGVHPMPIVALYLVEVSIIVAVLVEVAWLLA